MSECLFKRNRDILASYKVGMNVILHAQPASPDTKIYGFIDGFSMNVLGELVLSIKMAKYDLHMVDNHRVMLLNPYNQMYVIEIV